MVSNGNKNQPDAVGEVRGQIVDLQARLAQVHVDPITERGSLDLDPFLLAT